MLLMWTDSLPDSTQWMYELKLDGYRAIAFKRDGIVHLRSRNDNDFSGRYPGVVKGLAKMPDDTVIDGEVIAFDDDGRPSFNVLLNYGSWSLGLHSKVFGLRKGSPEVSPLSRDVTLGKWSGRLDSNQRPPAPKPVFPRFQRSPALTIWCRHKTIYLDFLRFRLFIGRRPMLRCHRHFVTYL